jgi:hypothetical protein
MNDFLKRGVPAELAKSINADQLVVTKIDDSDSKVVIGSLYLAARGASREFRFVT